jgi:hypothetical protein
MKNFILFIFLILVAFTSSHAQTKQSIGVDTLKIGNSSSAHDPIVEFAGTNVKLRANKSTGVAEFSNDGALWKKMGSGSGSGDGGVSIIENGSFEDGLTPGWTSSGGTFSQQTYTNGAEGETKYARFVSTVAGEYFETTLKTIPDFSKGGCLAKINYNTPDSSNWKLQVYDNTATPNLLKEETLYVKSWQDGYTSFPCPEAGTEVKMRVISLGSGQIESDKAYLGKENRTIQIAQAKLIGGIAISGCSWGTTATTYGDYGAPSGTCVYSPFGSASAPDSIVPGLKFQNLPRGEYLIVYSGALHSLRLGGSGASAKFRISDGSSASREEVVVGGAVSTDNASITTAEGSWSFNYTQAKDETTFRIQGLTTSSTNANATINSGYATGIITGSIKVYYYPSGTDTAMVPEAQDWFIDANIGGGVPSLGTAAVSSYTEATHTTLDMVLNNGSASAKIPCSATNASTGLTCSVGNESVGVNFVNPAVGFYEVCTAFSQEAVVAASSRLWTSFQLVETTPNTQTIIQEGKSRISTQVTSTTIVGYANRLCGTFYFPSVGERTIRLMYEQAVSGTVNASSLLADRSATEGQRDIHIVVRPLLSAYNRPYLTGDQMTIPSASKPVLVRVGWGETTGETNACTVSPCGLFRQRGGNWVNSVTRTALGDYVLNLNTSYWLDVLNVRCFYTSSSDPVQPIVHTISATGTMNFYLRKNTGTYTAFDGAGTLWCEGDKK